jgi:hypothetical protein
VAVGASGRDVVAVLTQGLRFPLNPIAPEHMRIILNAIDVCWQKLPASKALGEEKDVNALFEPVLNSHVQNDPLCKNLFSFVVRGKETVNFNGEKLEKRPDLQVMLATPRENFPLIIECKLIDHPNGKRVGMYCDEGIARFINGDYAWATREAIMLAYVRDGSDFESRLKPHLVASAGKKPDPLMIKVHPQADSSVHPTAYYSEHGRSFKYTAETNGDDPGTITLWHLWL